MRINFDIETYLEAKDIDFRPQNRAGFIILEECPFCGGKRKLYVYTDKEGEQYSYGKFKCFKCEIKPDYSFHFLQAKIEGKDPKDLEPKKHESTDDYDYLSFNIVAQPETKNTSFIDMLNKYPVMEMPPYTRLITKEDVDELKYLEKRGVSYEDALWLGIYVSDFKCFSQYKAYLEKVSEKSVRESLIESKRYIGRAIIPLKVLEKIYGFVARDTTGKVDPKYKVLNSRGALTTAFIWNFDNIKTSPRVVICEGIFDAIKIGLDQACALLGKNITEDSDKLKMLTTLRPKEWVIYSDIGALKESLKLASLIAKRSSSPIKIVKFEPIINRVVSEIPPEQLELVSKIIKTEVSGKYIIIHPEELKLLKDLIKSQSEDTKSSIDKFKNYERYRKNRPLFKRLKTLIVKLSDSSKKEETLSLLSGVESWDHVDAGDRDREVNEHFIENAMDYVPGLDLSLIM